MEYNGETGMLIFFISLLIFFSIWVKLADNLFFEENIFRFRNDFDQYKINNLKTPEDEKLFQKALEILKKGEYTEVEVVFSDGQKSVFSTSCHTHKKVLKMGGTGM